MRLEKSSRNASWPCTFNRLATATNFLFRSSQERQSCVVLTAYPHCIPLPPLSSRQRSSLSADTCATAPPRRSSNPHTLTSQLLVCVTCCLQLQLQRRLFVCFDCSAKTSVLLLLLLVNSVCKFCNYEERVRECECEPVAMKLVFAEIIAITQVCRDLQNFLPVS